MSIICPSILDQLIYITTIILQLLNSLSQRVFPKKSLGIKYTVYYIITITINKKLSIAKFKSFAILCFISNQSTDWLILIVIMYYKVYYILDKFTFSTIILRPNGLSVSHPSTITTIITPTITSQINLIIRIYHIYFR